MITGASPSVGSSSNSSRAPVRRRSEEHTSELQSQSNLVCRLLLEKKTKQGLLGAISLGHAARHTGRKGFRRFRIFCDGSQPCFFFMDPAPTEIYTLSLHDALPI